MGEIEFGLTEPEERPIYGRIADLIRFSVASGAVEAGGMVPSVRELSKRLGVNPNTVARAYRDLQAEGLLGAVRGTGLRVTEEAPERCREARRAFVRARLRGAIQEALRSDLDPEQIEAILREEWRRPGSQAAAPAPSPASAPEGGRPPRPRRRSPKAT
jgi:GntR family transcriptional regulator